MKIYYRACEKEPTISHVQRYKDYSKKTILRKCFSSLVHQITNVDNLIIIEDEVCEETLAWMQKQVNTGLLTMVSVPKHDFSYHQHTVTLVEILDQQTKAFPNETHLLVEDDYLFSANALSTVRSLKGLYDGFFVPYDYPDRYQNPFLCQVILGRTCHWRTVNSCTMTLGASGKAWQQIMPKLYEAAPTSNDKIFEEIFKTYGCISPLPGVATHLTAHHPTPYFNIEKRLEELE
jgi:hypothetical protein